MEAFGVEATGDDLLYGFDEASGNFQLNNYWMESLDYRFFTIHLNQHTAVKLPDGSVRLIVAHRDPGVPNWIDTVGHSSGTMCFRWVRADAHPVPRTRVVKHVSLTNLLP